MSFRAKDKVPFNCEQYNDETIVIAAELTNLGLGTIKVDFPFAFICFARQIVYFPIFISCHTKNTKLLNELRPLFSACVLLAINVI